MDIRLLLQTVVLLKPTQVVYQVMAKVSHPTIKNVVAPVVNLVPSIVKPIAKYECCKGNDFTFLNIKDSFHSWSQTNHGMLWAYNLNYMDWLNQESFSDDDSTRWIDKFIAELPHNHVGQDPYPIALRAINWIKVFCLRPHLRTQERDNSLYSQVLLLEKKLEYRLLGNHLLEDAYALFIASIYFDDKRLLKKASSLLKKQLKEQVLADGAHYEQSPMYHCILLDRLLDCINFSLTTGDTDYTNYLKGVAVRMLGHLECIVWLDGTIPMFNDCANGIAPTTKQIFNYAKRLGLSWEPIQLKECGYRKMENEGLEAILDVGNITASYQPGHSHADAFSFELRINGRPVIVDTGISTYNPTERRQYERSTPAHNCVCVNEKDSSEVWGGFRVGKRCKTQIISDEKLYVAASHNGYDKPCIREFQIKQHEFVIIDRYKGEAESYVHLAPGISPDVVHVEHAEKVEICDDMVSDEYNSFKETKCLKIKFKDYCKYRILTN